jgi:hypothetical protein
MRSHHDHRNVSHERQCKRRRKSTGPSGPEVGSHCRIVHKYCRIVRDGPPKQARWTPVVTIAQNRSRVRLHCRTVHNYPLLATLTQTRPCAASLPSQRAALWPGHRASVNSARRYAIRTSHRKPVGLPACRPAGGGVVALSLSRRVVHYGRVLLKPPLSCAFCENLRWGGVGGGLYLTGHLRCRATPHASFGSGRSGRACMGSGWGFASHPEPGARTQHLLTCVAEKRTGPCASPLESSILDAF